MLPPRGFRGPRRIINIGADSVRTGLMDHAMYSTPPGAACTDSHRTAREFAGSGITANTVARATCSTPSWPLFGSRPGPPSLLVSSSRGPPDRPARTGPVDQPVAATVAFLATGTTFITSQTIYVNGSASQ